MSIAVAVVQVTSVRLSLSLQSVVWISFNFQQVRNELAFFVKDITKQKRRKKKEFGEGCGGVEVGVGVDAGGAQLGTPRLDLIDRWEIRDIAFSFSFSPVLESFTSRNVSFFPPVSFLHKNVIGFQ